MCLWNPESSALESGIQLKESGILLYIGFQNPSFINKDWNPVPVIRNPRRGIQNPRLSWIPLYGSITRLGKIEIHNKTSCTKGHRVFEAHHHPIPTIFFCSFIYLFFFFKEKSKKKKKYNNDDDDGNDNANDTLTVDTKPSFLRQRCTSVIKRIYKTNQ